MDSLGRTTEETDPAGKITYTVYNDANHEVRTYAGWDSTANAPTGPTEVIRQDRPGSYTETLTMSATLHLTNGAPDGTAAISNLQTLARSYTNPSGQVVRGDAYFNPSGVTYSTAGKIGVSSFFGLPAPYAQRRLADMGRPPRLAADGSVYHALNRGNNRARAFSEGADFQQSCTPWA